MWFEFRPGLRMRLNVRELIHQTIVFEGLWDPPLTKLINETLEPGGVFVDVGAHSGYFTLLAAQQVGPLGRVIAIEPNPHILDELVENIGASGLTNVAVQRSACTDTDEERYLYIYDATNSSRSSLSSANVASRDVALVHCTTLDSLLKNLGLDRVDLIKIDVEGAELSVLKGAAWTLQELKPSIVLELDADLLGGFDVGVEDVVAFLKNSQYVCHDLGGHSNYLFKRECS